MKTLLIGLLGIVCLSVPAMAQVPPRLSISPPMMMAPPHPPRTITVTGEAQEDIAPDEAVLSLSLTSRDKSLQAARQHNDAMANRLLAIAGKLAIPQDKITTSDVVIAPQYTWNNNEQHFTGYLVSRSLRITMDKLDIPEKLLSAVVDARIDQVNGLDYRLADPEAHTGPLRVKAFADAKARAEALAAAAGGKLGQALDISTDGSNTMPYPPRPMPMMRAMAAPMGSVVAPSLPGLIELHESVQVTFALE